MVLPEPPPADRWPGSGVWAGPDVAEGNVEIARYKLAGTFQVLQSEEEGIESAALVDDLEQGVQQIVWVGDDVGFFEVTSISENRLTLSRGDRSWVLALSGAPASSVTAQTEETEEVTVDPLDLPALETSRFGKKVKENYWVMEREVLKNYIDEMMMPRNMIRTVNLYRSFSQVAEEGDDEPGFQIGMKAEEEFFRDMGLQDGDIIRRVNSMKMKTQRRAEYLLKEFYNDNMSAIVLDVERGGEMQQHIYLVR